jgi:hypothetical protein
VSNNRWLRVGVPLLVAIAAAWWLIGGPRSSEEDAIRKRLLEGKAAWEAQDVQKFMSFFDVTYQDRSGALNYGMLLEYHRARLFKERCQLRADVRDITIKVSGQKGTVTFDATASRDCGTGPSYFVGEPGHPVPITLELAKSGSVTKDWKVVRSSGAVNAETL